MSNGRPPQFRRDEHPAAIPERPDETRFDWNIRASILFSYLGRKEPEPEKPRAASTADVTSQLGP